MEYLPQLVNQNDYNDDHGGGGKRPNFPGGGGGLVSLSDLVDQLSFGRAWLNVFSN